jgi:hypothetical protein
MVRIMFSLMLLLMVVVVAAQSKTAPVLSRDYYLTKSKKLKSTGTVLIAVGLAATITGFVLASTADPDDDAIGLDGYEKVPGHLLAGAGIITAVSGIAFFIKAGKYDHKAAALSFGNRKIISPFRPGFIAASQPTVSLNVRF